MRYQGALVVSAAACRSLVISRVQQG
jgi:hypothetical protein